MPAIDLHVHSIGSPDGGVSLAQIGAMLASQRLDVVAITDHDTIEVAQEAQRRYGRQIIVGEEISALEGEVIGLFLSAAVPAGLSAAATMQAIHRQHGLVYVPHPFETVRSGLQARLLDQLAAQIDILETRNGRALWGARPAAAQAWATRHGVAAAASSDAHGRSGWGRTYSLISEQPTAQNLPQLLAAGELHYRRPRPLALAYPTLNRLRRRR